uniref:Uncharacterized protein n=1 Tax=Arundo donax TaxID=35708 RepID=A0A0A8ZZ48_ARUDO
MSNFHSYYHLRCTFHLYHWVVSMTNEVWYYMLIDINWWYK